MIVSASAAAETRTVTTLWGDTRTITIKDFVGETTIMVRNSSGDVVQMPVFLIPMSGTEVTFHGEQTAGLCETYVYMLGDDGIYFQEGIGGFYLEVLTDGTIGVKMGPGTLGYEIYIDYDVVFYWGDIFFKYDNGNTALPVQTEDSPSTWAVEQVNAAIAAGLVPEQLQRNYQGSVTRGEVAQMFINLIEEASGQSIEAFMESRGVTIDNNAFTDTNDSAVLAANALGIIQGVGNNRFDPDGVFTRAHVAVIINRVARVLGVDTEGYTHSFTDVQGHWADQELGWPVHAGIIEGVGDNRFDPEAPLTTEAVIIVAYHALAPLSA